MNNQPLGLLSSQITIYTKAQEYIVAVCASITLYHLYLHTSHLINEMLFNLKKYHFFVFLSNIPRIPILRSLFLPSCISLLEMPQHVILVVRLLILVLPCSRLPISILILQPHWVFLSAALYNPLPPSFFIERIFLYFFLTCFMFG